MNWDKFKDEAEGCAVLLLAALICAVVGFVLLYSLLSSPHPFGG